MSTNGFLTQAGQVVSPGKVLTSQLRAVPSALACMYPRRFIAST
jgi:hypothetical protein